MSIRSRLDKLEAVSGNTSTPLCADLPARIAKMLADPAAVERELAWDNKYLNERSPFKIDTDSGDTILAALERDPPDGADFQPWFSEQEEGGQL